VGSIRQSGRVRAALGELWRSFGKKYLGDARPEPDPARVRRQLLELREQGIASLAVCLLHAFEHR